VPLVRAHLVRLGCVAAVAGCGEPLATYEALPELRAALADTGLEPIAVDTGIAALAWQAPSASCSHVFRLRAHYEPELMHEGDHDDTLAIGLAPKQSRAGQGAPLPPGETAKLWIWYQGLRAEKRGSAREVFLSAEQVGPSAPTAACTPRTWDPMEDAFALGWPRLPARIAALDEHWTGLRVEGRCNRSACVNPHTGGGGPDEHERTCVTMSWDERLAGVVEIGGERFALVESRWSDGHAERGDEGITTRRLALVSIDHGRPVWVRVVIDHPFPQMTAEKRMAPVQRTWTLEAIDACPGSLASVGWERPADLVAEHDRAIQALGDSDDLRTREEARRRKEDEPEGDPFAPPPS
jgi:hypothetical protein